MSMLTVFTKKNPNKMTMYVAVYVRVYVDAYGAVFPRLRACLLPKLFFIHLLLFLQKQNLAFAVYLLGSVLSFNMCRMPDIFRNDNRKFRGQPEYQGYFFFLRKKSQKKRGERRSSPLFFFGIFCGTFTVTYRDIFLRFFGKHGQHGNGFFSLFFLPKIFWKFFLEKKFFSSKRISQKISECPGGCKSRLRRRERRVKACVD